MLSKKEKTLLGCLIAILVSLPIYLVVFANHGEPNKDSVERNSSFFQSDDREFGIHPFRSQEGYALVIPASWDSTAIAKQGLSDGKPLEIFRSSLPVFLITTASGSMKEIDASVDKKVSESGTIKIFDAEGQVAYRGLLEKIGGRGNFTWKHDPKRPYNIRLDGKVKLHGLKKDDSFSLIASYTEPTMVRNYIALETADKAGLPHAVRSTFVQVYLNGYYAGVYQITNKLDISKGSVDIEDLAKATQQVNEQPLKKCKRYSEGKDKNFDLRSGIVANNPTDITGGYLIETYAVDVSAFHVHHAITASLKSPKYATREQIDYISARYQEMLDAIYAKDGVNPATGKHYSQYIDVESFAKYYLLQEVFLNRDGGVGSVYLFKDTDTKDSLFYAGPLWDMGSGIGNPCLNDFALHPDVFFVKDKQNYEGEPIFLGRLYQHPEFRQLTDSLYQYQMRDIIADHSLGVTFDSIFQQIAPELRYNNQRWSQPASDKAIKNDFDVIRSFMEQRLAFFDRIMINHESGKRINVQIGNPAIFLQYFLREGESLNLPQVDRIKGEYARDDWYIKGSDIPYVNGTPLADGDTITMRWHKKTLMDMLRYAWDKKHKILEKL